MNIETIWKLWEVDDVLFVALQVMAMNMDINGGR
jgi:hypothetical protein